MNRVLAGRRWEQDAKTLAWLRRGPKELSNLVDSLRIEIDGVPLNAGLPDEPLLETCLDLALALGDLNAGESSRGLSLREAGLELLLARHGSEVELVLVRRGRGGAAVLGRAAAELSELSKALSQCARDLLEALSRLHPRLGSVPKVKQLRAAAKRLSQEIRPELSPTRGRSLTQPRSLADQATGWSFQRRASAGPISLTLHTFDIEGRLSRYRRSQPDLYSLLVPGHLELGNEAGTPLDRCTLPPFLALEDLLRQAERASTPGTHSDALPFGSERQALSLENGALCWGDRRWEGASRPFVAAVAGLASSWATSVVESQPEQAHNPLLSDFLARARVLVTHSELLARGDQPGLEKAPTAERARPAQPPLSPNALRKVSFDELGRVRLPFPVSELQLFGGSRRCLAFGTEGVALLELPGARVLWARRAMTVAAGRGPLVIAHDRDGRLMQLDLRTGDALWFREAPDREPRSLLCVLEGKKAPNGVGPLAVLEERAGAISAFALDTGAPLWRQCPPLTSHLWASVSSDWAYASTSNGQFFAMRVADGHTLFRLGSNRPLHEAPLRVGRSLFQLADGEDQDHLVQLDASSGEVRGVHPLGLHQTGPLVAHKTMVATVGRSAGRWTLGHTSTRTISVGQVALPFEGPRPALLATSEGMLCTSAKGEAALIGTDGKVCWHSSEIAEPTSTAITPIYVRRVALVASERPVLLDLVGHRILAQLPRLEGLSAIAADRHLHLVLADDEGEVVAYRLRGHLSVVRGPNR
jgi:hypothetical protein